MNSTSNEWRAYTMAAALILAALTVRALLTPLWGSHHAYTVFYPAVLLSAYLGGRRVGLAATGAAALVGHWVFVPPAFGLKLTLDSIGYMLFFVANCSVAVVLITGLNETLRRISREHEESRALAHSHASLFREINERVGHHLQLVAHLLLVQSNEEVQRHVSDAMARAADVSIALSKLHRDWARETSEPVDFMPFAASLLREKLASERRPPETIALSGSPLQVPVDQATSLGIALLECASVLLARDGDDRVSIRIDARDSEVTISMSDGTALDLGGVADGQLLKAVVRQGGGRMSVQVDDRGAKLRILFAADLGVPSTAGALH